MSALSRSGTFNGEAFTNDLLASDIQLRVRMNHADEHVQATRLQHAETFIDHPRYSADLKKGRDVDVNVL